MSQSVFHHHQKHGLKEVRFCSRIDYHRAQSINNKTYVAKSSKKYFFKGIFYIIQHEIKSQYIGETLSKTLLQNSRILFHNYKRE